MSSEEGGVIVFNKQIKIREVKLFIIIYRNCLD